MKHILKNINIGILAILIVILAIIIEMNWPMAAKERQVDTEKMRVDIAQLDRITQLAERCSFKSKKFKTCRSICVNLYSTQPKHHRHCLAQLEKQARVIVYKSFRIDTLAEALAKMSEE